MALLERSQHSHRRLAFRALLDQLQANPAAIGRHVDPEEAWRILAEVERRAPDVVADILLYPTVGVWLTRAMHYTRPGRTTMWPELGYLHAVVAAAAIRSGHPSTIRVPVAHGIVSLPTVGQIHVPGSFPVGSVEVICAGRESRVRVSRAITVPLDDRSAAFTPARQHMITSRGMTLRAWIEDKDPYHAFSEPRSPTELTESSFAEWHKLLDESWDILTLHHPDDARELARGLRTLGPIEPDRHTVGASSPAAFGGIRLSASGSATDFAEALVHEMQHSKLNALLGLVELTDDNRRTYLAPWRDDPRPLVGVVHGIYAFTCGVEFWLTQASIAQNLDETRHVTFDIAHRRLQIRRAIDTALASERLTPPGRALVRTASARLAVCEQLNVDTEIAHTVTMMVDDHKALWRLRHVLPNAAVMNAMAQAWLAGEPAPAGPGDHHVTATDERRLPANRRNLLRAKVTEPDQFASLVRQPTALPGPTARADAALCVGDYDGAARAYSEHLGDDPDSGTAWVGLGLAWRGAGRDAAPLLDHPELTVAVHRRVRALGGRAPDPAALSAWLRSAL